MRQATELDRLLRQPGDQLDAGDTGQVHIHQQNVQLRSRLGFQKRLGGHEGMNRLHARLALQQEPEILDQSEVVIHNANMHKSGLFAIGRGGMVVKVKAEGQWNIKIEAGSDALRAGKKLAGLGGPRLRAGGWVESDEIAGARQRPRRVGRPELLGLAEPRFQAHRAAQLLDPLPQVLKPASRPRRIGLETAAIILNHQAAGLRGESEAKGDGAGK